METHPELHRRSPEMSLDNEPGARTKPNAALITIRPGGGPEKTAEQRRLFLKCYESSFGNVSASCAFAGISRQTFYRWMRDTSGKYLRFQRHVENTKPAELRKDLIEGALMDLVIAGNIRAILFAVKSYCKDRF
jgi:hypothetical protein